MDLWKVLALLVCVCCVDKTSAIPKDNDRDCSTCVERLSSFVDFIRNEMANGDMVDPGQMCQEAPVALRKFCQELVASYKSDVSVNLDTRHVATLCQMLNQCRKTRSNGYGNDDLVFGAEIEPTTLDLASDVEGLPCMLCENFMRLAQAFLKSKTHQIALYRLLKGACRFVPFVRTECEQLVSKYGWLFIHLAAQWLNPELCKLFHICSAGLVTNENSCRICEFSVGIIQDSLDDPALRSRLTKAMDQLCEDIGGDQDTCDEVTSGLNEYLPDIIKSLREKSELSHLCQDTGICKKDLFEDSVDSESESVEDE